MKAGFALPSCNYNIVLSKEELNRLMAGGYLCIRPNNDISLHVRDTNGIINDGMRHYLQLHIEDDYHSDHFVQFLTIGVEDKPLKPLNWNGERGEYTCPVCKCEAPNNGYWPSPYCPKCGTKLKDPVLKIKK